MKVEIRMPEVAADITAADVVGWLVAPGDPVTEGDVVLEIETDKSTVEIEAPATGVLREILVPAGTSNVPVGQVLALIDSENVAAETEPTPPPESAMDTEPLAPLPSAAAADPAAPLATALAKRLAERAGLDLARVAGSGAHGRVLRADIENQLEIESLPLLADADTRDAAATAENKAPAEVIRLGTTCRIDPLLDVLERINRGRITQPISLESGLVRAVAMAMAKTPELRSQDSDKSSTPDPPTRLSLTRSSGEPGIVLEQAESQGLDSLSSLLNNTEIVPKTQPADLGLLAALDEGIDWAEPTLQPGQTLALGLGSPRESPTVENGEMVLGTLVEISLCADANSVDRIVASQLLQALRKLINDPLSMSL